MTMQKVYSFATVTLSTLGGGVAILGNTRIDATRLQGCRLKDIFGTFNWEGKAANEGPVYYGFCAGLTVAQIAEVFNADPQSQDDPTGDESMQRLIVVGQMPFADQSDIIEDDHWHKLMWPSSWQIREGDTFDVFAFNRDSGALTTGALLHFDGMFNTEWRQD